MARLPGMKRSFGRWQMRFGGAWMRRSISMWCWGCCFLKYVSDAFQEAHAELETQLDDGADPRGSR